MREREREIPASLYINEYEESVYTVHIYRLMTQLSFSGVGLCLAIFGIALLPIFFALELRRQYKREANLKRALKKTFQPSPKFGPRDRETRRQYDDFLVSRKGGDDVEEGEGGESPDHPLPPDASAIDMTQVSDESRDRDD